MPERMSYFQCQAVTASAPEIINDIDLGELQISVVIAECEPQPKRAALIVDDPDLGSLVIGPAPAMRAMPHRTGPPRSPSKAGGR